MKQDGRDRVTVDLRGAGARLHECATKRGVTVAAFVRRAVLAAIEQPSEPLEGCDAIDAFSGSAVFKVTLRLPVANAVLLRMRARRADVSQGAYVAALLDGMPLPPDASDRREVLAALLRSTDQLAIISTDLNKFMRLLGRSSSAELEPYRARIKALPEELSGHLATACRFLAAVRESSPTMARTSPARRRR